MKQKGFTLAELLIALLILGVIATFTIPKVLSSQQSNEWNAKAKEAIASSSEAFKLLQLEIGINASTTSSNLSPYLNYVRLQTVGDIDGALGQTTLTCSPGSPCLHLHNGGVLAVRNVAMLGTSTTHCIPLFFDPDGVYSGTTNGPGKSVHFFIYANGLVRTRDSVSDPSCNATLCPFSATTDKDPAWFNWD